MGVLVLYHVEIRCVQIQKRGTRKRPRAKCERATRVKPISFNVARRLRVVTNSNSNSGRIGSRMIISSFFSFLSFTQKEILSRFELVVIQSVVRSGISQGVRGHRKEAGLL
ncbi:hypothetical protein AAC387_Pa01g0820 [Persea americana]